MVMITGITGAVMAPFICKVFKMKNKIAVGIAIGTASHAVGTSRAIEMGETEGAMSGLAIGVAGVLTVFILPLLYIVLF
jgi:putative effector of murein hydrolase